MVFLFAQQARAQKPEQSSDPLELVRTQLVGHGYIAEDLADLVLKDKYQDEHNGVSHTFLRQRWKGIEVFNGDLAVHQSADGKLLKLNNGAWSFAGRTAEAPEPSIPAEQALAVILAKDGVRAAMPAWVATEENGHRHVYDGTAFNEQPVTVQLMYLPTEDTLRLVWNVNYYEPGGAHWWNVQVSALTAKELRRNDWVSNCGFGHAHEGAHAPLEVPAESDEAPMLPMAPAGSMEYNVYPIPVESPSHGSRSLVTAPWNAAGAASPYGWHDTNGSAGAEYTITRGNNVHAQEDANGNNGTGYAPDGGASLSFDYSINLNQAPSTYRDAAITNLFYWNNVMHDVWYQYGFNEVSGNFQQNNYGRGGLGNDYVYADAQDGYSMNNANFATPPDGSNPRMQMFLWNQTSPNRDGDLDAGIIAHEYGHGISIRLVGGPSNSNCLNNAEQMGEGWSDFFGLMMTMKASHTRTTNRGVGTYVMGQSNTGTGIRPAPYNTSFGVNGFTYGATTNPSYQYTHDIGFIWCTILWEMAWDLIDEYGFDPDLYNGTGGNNIAMQLVIDGLKLTPCSPGFVDGRDAILAADQQTYGGAHTNLLWGAFARRGLGYGASQGSSNNLNDQTEAFNLPLNKNVGVTTATPGGSVLSCAGMGVPVVATVSNNGLEAQSGISVRYSFNGGPYVTQAFPGTLAPGASAAFTFDQTITITPGTHTLVVGTVLSGDQYPGDDSVTNQINAADSEAQAPPVGDGAENGVVPAGWTLQNPDNSTTWTTATVNNGPNCSSTKAWVINYYSYSATGQEDRLLTPPINLAGMAGARLAFNHAYARYNSSYYDAFRVDVSSDCGGTWNTVYSAAGSDLATTSDQTGQNWAPANCSQWASHDIDLGAYDGQTIIVRFVGICGYGQKLYMDNISVTASSAFMPLNVRMYLGGPYNIEEERMNDGLRTSGQIPATEPYTALGFNLPGGGGETVDPGVLAITGNNAVVDWVVVELRDRAQPANIVAAQCALVQRDGDVIGATGSSTLGFAVPAGSYRVAVRHRNHLGCMTANDVVLGSTPATVDFSLGSTTTFGTAAQQVVEGKRMLWPGNILPDGMLKYTGVNNDRDLILQAIGTVPTTVINGYLPTDANLDGSVKYTGVENDRDVILTGVGGSAPTSIRYEQLP